MKTKTALSKVRLAVFDTPLFGRILLSIFAIITLLMPLLYLQVNYFIIAAVILVIVMVAVRSTAKSKLYVTVQAVVTKHPILTVFIVALVTRLVWVIVLSTHTTQVSDFLAAYDDSLVSIPTSSHVPVIAHYITYPWILHFFATIFGDSALVGGIFNAVTMSVSITLVFLLGSLVANRKVGFLAAILMSLWPGIAAYTSIYAPDHLSICFMLAGIYLFVRFMEAKRTRTKIIYALSCLLSLWALGFFKDMAPLLMIAFAGIVLVVAICSRSKESWINVVFTMGLGVGYLLVSMTHVPIISAIVGQPVNPSISSYLVYVGLGGNDTGSWQPEIMNHYRDIIKQDNDDYGQANKTMLHEALGNIKHRLSDIPTTIWNKNHNVQAGDDAKIYWVEASATSSGSTHLHDALQTILEPINSIFFGGIILLMCAGTYYLWGVSENWKMALLVIVCIGCSLVLLIFEAQNRYRYVIEPLYCIIAAFGLFHVNIALSRRRQKAKI